MPPPRLPAQNWKHYEHPLMAEHNIDNREDIEGWHLGLAKNFSKPDAL